MIFDQLLFILIFVLSVPLGAAFLSETITQEEIFSYPRAYIEAHSWPMFAYLVNCTVCMTYWTSAFFTLLCYDGWNSITFFNGWIIAFICWAAVTKVSIQFCLRHN